ncbi:hypothetical protein HAX54_032292 [Datura stramonium]|uniref:Uncharacterized protein n=1 Tax=Datura stramonium TaxID=4076 RepID=A0ABS8SCJ3_DATST|nr:hypothetical protein [Datura stramonium]
MEQAISDLCCSLFPETLYVADLGCSSGANTFLVSLGKFQQDLRKQIGEGFGSCYFSGVAGSFYTRLFPSKVCIFVHSSYSLMWLSQVPDLIEKEPGKYYMASTSPPSEEKVKILLVKNVACYVWELLSMALNRLVIEGLIEEEWIRQHTSIYTITSRSEPMVANVSKCMRAVAEPLLLSQFDPKFMDLVFQKYEEIISDCMAKEKTEFINVTVSLTKKNGHLLSEAN